MVFSVCDDFCEFQVHTDGFVRTCANSKTKGGHKIDNFLLKELKRQFFYFYRDIYGKMCKKNPVQSVLKATKDFDITTSRL